MARSCSIGPSASIDLQSTTLLRAARVLRRDLLRPAVVRLAGWRAHDLIDLAQLARHLVARDLRAAVLLDVVERGRLAGPELDHRGDALAPARIGHADDRAVEDRRVRLDGRLDLLGEDLLAARVDRHRAAAEQRDAPVRLDLAVVPRH